MATLIQKFFKPKWQHAKADVRLQALQTLDDQTVLLDLAQNDDDVSVQLAALNKLADLDQLVGFFNHDQNQLKESALKRFLSLLLGFENTADQLKALSSLNESTRLMQIATYAPEESLRQGALEQIQDETALYDFINSSPSAKARQLAAQRIEKAEYLEELQKRFKGKDKNLVRLAKEKRQQQLQVEQALAEQKQAIDKTLEQAQTLSESAFSPTYAAQLAHLKQSWPKLVGTDENHTQRFESFIAISEQVLKDNQAQAEALEKAKAETEKNLEQQHNCVQAITAYLNGVKETNKADLATISELIKSQQHNWLETEKTQKADKTLKAEFEALLKTLLQMETSLSWLNANEDKLSNLRERINKLDEVPFGSLVQTQKELNKAIKATVWPQDLPDIAAIQWLAQSLQKVDQRLTKVKQDEQNQLSKIDAVMTQLEEAIAGGHVKDAKRLQRSLSDTLGKVSDDKAKAFQNRKHLLQGQLQELMDWQGFATTPKMEELCLAMEALVNTDKAPDVLAEEINILQQEWKLLGSGERKTSQQLWERFKSAADTAYEPCREHFHAQGEQRKLNKQKRENLCEQLEAFVEQNDWANADWKSLPALCDKAKEEWKTYSPVDRRDHKILQERFNKVLGIIRGKLTEEFERNANRKQALIDQVKALIEEEDLSVAIERCKEIQTEWKSVPQAGRKDFNLWKSFRAECDALFNRRDEEKNQRKAAIDEAIAQAEALIQQAKDILEASEAEHGVKRAGIDETKQAFAELQLPKRIYERIRNEFSDIDQKLTDQLHNAKQMAEKLLWLNARDISNELAALEHVKSVSPEDLASVKQKLSDNDLPSATRSPLQKRLEALETGNVLVATNDELQNICLELEISMGLESPASDKDARMALQVNLLQSRMGQGSLPRHEQKNALTVNWLSMSGQSEQYSNFAQRFFDGLDRA